MAVIQCKKCGREVSDEMQFCPYCGVASPAIRMGTGFEWKSKISFYGYPLIHIAIGRDENGKIRVAKGIIAIGQFGIGLITIAQVGIGLLFGFGQFMLGLVTIAQFSAGIIFGIGQFATGYVAIGQIALGWYTLCQLGFAKYLWTPKIKDPEAVRFFMQLLTKLEDFFHLR